ncbi:hypothetical protein C8R46DRAFT_1097672 [Mycena filopes]|nr:hypothetical protein C8R46DRAFT_1097672 [Mycena filopes]
MFSLIRRFSGSVIPRPDRPWADDPTSNAPRVGHKRRMADEDRDEDDEEQARQKKVRGATDEALPDATRESSSTPLPQAPETAGVKEVTQGVKEVELETKPQAVPESVPLPEEKAGELDADASSTASTPPPTGEPSETQDTDAAVVSEAAPAPEPASGDAVSDSAVVDPKATTTDAPDLDAIATDPASAPAPASDRPVKKLRAKRKSAAEPTVAAPVEET